MSETCKGTGRVPCASHVDFTHPCPGCADCNPEGRTGPMPPEPSVPDLLREDERTMWDAAEKDYDGLPYDEKLTLLLTRLSEARAALRPFAAAQFGFAELRAARKVLEGVSDE